MPTPFAPKIEGGFTTVEFDLDMLPHGLSMTESAVVALEAARHAGVVELQRVDKPDFKVDAKKLTLLVLLEAEPGTMLRLRVEGCDSAAMRAAKALHDLLSSEYNPDGHT